MPKSLALLLSLIFHVAGLSLFLLVPREERAPVGASLEVVPVEAQGARAQTKSPRTPIAESGDQVQAKAAKTVAPTSSTGERDSGEAKEIGVSDGAQASARERYLYELRLYLDQNKQYPAKARALRQSGRVVVSFEVGEDGSFREVRLLGTSPFSALNEEALELFRRLGRFRPLPSELRDKRLALEVPIEFRLDR